MVPHSHLPPDTRVARSDGIVALARMAVRRDLEPGRMGHGSRVASLAGAVAKEMKHDDPDSVYLAGLVHDVGIVSLSLDPGSIPRRLTNIERHLLREHPVVGARIGVRIGLSLEVLEGILFHHERLDGSGYPVGMKGNAIPIISHIVGVADTYEALCASRSYKVAWPPRRAHEYLRKRAGRSIPCDVVAALLAVTTRDISRTG